MSRAGFKVSSEDWIRVVEYEDLSTEGVEYLSSEVLDEVVDAARS